jgi:hypothetical protein
MKASQMATGYATASFLVTAFGVGFWLASWRDSTTLLPWNRFRRSFPAFVRRTLITRRLSFWVVIVGLANFLLAVIIIPATQ